MALCDYLHDPEHIAAALREGIVGSLVNLLCDCDVTVRQKATECLYVIATHAIGRQAFVDHEVIVPLSCLFDDCEDIVRKNAQMAMEMASESPVAAEAILEACLISRLVRKLEVELDEIKEFILDTLHFCFKCHVQDALDCGGMYAFNTCLHHERESIRSKGARNIADLCQVLEGKEQAVEVKCMDRLVELLRDQHTCVRANSANAIMRITITTRGKYTALEAGALPQLVALVDDGNSEVRVNCLKAITCLSEAPEGRKALQEHLVKIQDREKDRIPAVCKAANIAVKTILWKP
jgi:hypothetical protein